MWWFLAGRLYLWWLLLRRYLLRWLLFGRRLLGRFLARRFRPVGARTLCRYGRAVVARILKEVSPTFVDTLSVELVLVIKFFF